MTEKRIAAILMAHRDRANALGARLSQHGYSTYVAHSTDEFYEKAGQETFDVLVIENKLSGFLNGMEIVARLYNELVRPVTILLAIPSSELRERANKLSIAEVLSPESHIDRIVEAVNTKAAHTILNRRIVPALARRVVCESDNVQPLPQFLVKLAETLREDDCTDEDIAQDIANDPKATADVLRLANSSALGRVNRTRSLSEAIGILGIKRVVSLVLSAGLVHAQRDLLMKAPGDLRARFGYRSMLIGSTAAAFAKNLEQVPPETAYILGLLQDIGILALAQAYGTQYLDILKRVREVAHLRLEQMERTAFGISHADVSAALLQKWGLPDYLVTTIGSHHLQESVSQLPEAELSFLRVMQIGEAVANIAERKTTQDFIHLSQLLQHYGKHKADLCRLSLSEGIARVKESAYILSLPVPDEEGVAQLVKELQSYGEYEVAEGNEGSAAIDGVPAATSFVEVDSTERFAEVETDAFPTVSQDIFETSLKKENSLSILVIEDETPIVNLVRRIVSTLGIEVLHGTNSVEAAQFAPQVQMILCDIHLREEDGVEIIRCLRQNGCSAPVLMVTGDSHRSTVERSIEAGISGYLIKPFSRMQLVEKLYQCSAAFRERILIGAAAPASP